MCSLQTDPHGRTDASPLGHIYGAANAAGLRLDAIHFTILHIIQIVFSILFRCRLFLFRRIAGGCDGPLQRFGIELGKDTGIDPDLRVGQYNGKLAAFLSAPAYIADIGITQGIKILLVFSGNVENAILPQSLFCEDCTFFDRAEHTGFISAYDDLIGAEAAP